MATLSIASCGGNKSESAAVAEEAQDTVVAEQTVEGGVVELTNDALDVTPGTVAFIDFNATWCGPCRMYGPTFHEVAEAYADKATFYSVDTDKNPNVAQKYVGQYIPQTTAIAADGQVFSKTGQLSKEELTAFVDSVLAIPAK